MFWYCRRWSYIRTNYGNSRDYCSTICSSVTTKIESKINYRSGRRENQFKGLYPGNFLKKIIFVFLMFFGTLKNGKCYLFLLLRTFYASIFHLKIDSLEEYSLVTDIRTSFNCFKPQYYTENQVFVFFLWSRTP